MGKKKKLPKVDAYAHSEEAVKEFKKFKDNIEIPDWDFYGNLVLYKVKLKGNTRQADIFDHVSDVRSRLRLPLFQVYKEGFDLYIAASEEDIKYPRLPKVLNSVAYKEKSDQMNLPCIVGHNVLGQPAIVDLSTFPHLLLGGSTNSGKSVALQAEITCIAISKPPSKVNFVLIDVGAGDLLGFDGIPHLSCPVVRDYETAYRTLAAVKAEMERRVHLEHTNPDEFKKLPRLVLVIDEFPALFMGLDNKKILQQMRNDVSSLLQRGRHAKIHLILAAQNPTVNNMKVDLGNITARIAFRCAKQNFSETILGKSGAENLTGPGSLLLKSPQSDDLQQLQGIYIKPKEIRQIVNELKSRQYSYKEMDQKFNLTIPSDPQEETKDKQYPRLQSLRAVASGPSEHELQLAAVIFWAFGKNHISTNLLMAEHHLGWNKAANLVRKLEQLGIVGPPNGKQPRTVRPKRIDDISDELVEFMECCDYPKESLACAFQERVTVSI